MSQHNSEDEPAEIDIDFIKEHLLILDMHLRLLLQATKDFDGAFKKLTMVDYNVDLEKDRDEIWNNLASISDACWRVGQIMRPNSKSLNKDEEPELKKQYKLFVKKRGEQIRELLDLELSDKKNINEIRNAAVHVDERLDEWYIKNTYNNVRPKKVSYRSLAKGVEPTTDAATAHLFWFDYVSGAVYHLGAPQPYYLESISEGIDMVKNGIKRADVFLQTHFGNKGRRTLFRISK